MGSQQLGQLNWFDLMSQLSTQWTWYWCIHGKYRMLSPKIEINFVSRHDEELKNLTRLRRKKSKLMFSVSVNHRRQMALIKKINTYQPQSRSYKYRIRSRLFLPGSFRLCSDVLVNAEWVRFVSQFWFVRLLLKSAGWFHHLRLLSDKMLAVCFPTNANQ